MRRTGWTMLLAGLALALGAGAAHAEYRAYELEVVDLYDCRVNQREECRTSRVLTAMSPELYVRTHGGGQRIGALLIATWMCYGDTSFYRAVCSRPPAREPRFSVGDEVVVTLGRHITEGWRGRVEVAYYQASVRSNVYGVRFEDRKDVYARYFEKDLRPAGEAPPEGEGDGEGGGQERTPQQEPEVAAQ